MKEQLQRILDDFDYEKALKWYTLHVEGKFFLKELFAKGPDPYNVQKLKSELIEILNKLTPSPVAVAIEKNDEGKEPLKLVTKAAISPEEYHLDKEWKPIFKESHHRFQQITEDMSDEERKELAFAVLDGMDEVEKFWKQKDFIQKFGVSPDFNFQGLDSMTPMQKQRRILTLRTYLTKAKKGKLGAAKIPGWEAEIQELERSMKG
jgi:patatin-like phospholipase/acyl hydrolase